MPSDPRTRIVFGCGSQALYVIDALRAQGSSDPAAAVDLENEPGDHRAIAGVRIVSLSHALAAWRPDSADVIVAHGNNTLKPKTAASLAGAGYSFFSAIHPHAYVSVLANIGAGCIINAGVIVMPQARIDDHTIVHSGAVIEHDCVIGTGCNVAPGVSMGGRVLVGRGAYLYTGCSIAPNIRIGDRAIVGGGAVVIQSVDEDTAVVGNPASQLQRSP